MSVKASSWVWDRSRQQGAALTVLLAIADFADDEGYAWPSIAVLARKARLGARQVQRVLRDLMESGELRVLLRAGPAVTTTGGTQRPNLFQVLMGGVTSVTTSQGGDIRGRQVVTKTSQGGDISRVRLEPPKEPSKREPPKQAEVFPALAVLWNDLVPRPTVLRVTGQRAVHLRARMDTYPDLTWWRRVLERLVATPFLRGQGPRGWLADFDWLIRNDENPLRVLEGKYDDLTVRDALAGLPEGRA